MAENGFYDDIPEVRRRGGGARRPAMPGVARRLDGEFTLPRFPPLPTIPFSAHSV